jgi:hypothetical protein
MQMRIVMEERYTGSQHSMPFVLNGLRSLFGISQYTSDVIVVPYYMHSTISTPFLFQKTDAISFLVDI